MNRKIVGLLTVVGLSVGFLAGGCDDPEPGPCDGVKDLTINAPAVGTTIPVGQPSTIDWCYGPTDGVMIWFDDENEVRTKLNPDPTRQVSDVTSITWTPTATMVGTGYIIIHDYTDPDVFVEVQVTVQ